MQAIRPVEKEVLPIPLRYRGLTFNDFRVDDYEGQKTIRYVAEQYVSTFTDRLKKGTSLIFNGSHGTGKTMLAMIMSQALRKMSFSVYYEPSIYQLIDHLNKRRWVYRGDNRGNCYLDYPLLIIDNIFKDNELLGSFDSREKHLFFNIIDERYRNNRNTLLIGNCNKEDLTHLFGEACMDRLLGTGIFLSFNGNSYRTNKVNDYV